MVKDKEDKKKLFETDFEDLVFSTQTVISITNFQLNIEEFYNKMECISIIPNKEVSSFDYLKNGSIVFMKIEEKEKGVEPLKGAVKSKRKTKKSTKELTSESNSASSKSKKSYKKGMKNFLNSLTIVMYIKIKHYQKKFMNFKISRNGKFQLTGCKSIEHAKACVKNIWKIANNKDIFPEPILKCESGIPKAIFKKVMINTDFYIGYEINREELDRYICEKTEYVSNFERSGGYTGVNIKLFCNEPENFPYPILTWDINDHLKSPEQSFGLKSDWYSLMSESDIKTEKKKKPRTTTIVFTSGCTILSGPYMYELEKTYNWLRNLFKEKRSLFEQKFDD